MKLYLSSFRLGDKRDHLVKMAKRTRFAFVGNALDGLTDLTTRQTVITRGIEDLREISLESDLIDLREFFTEPTQLRVRLAPYKAIFVSGGNAFILRRAMRQSGLDAFLQEKKNDDTFLYAGYSAGACVCGPTMNGFDKVDDPQLVPAGYPSDLIWAGLGLLDYNIAPHYQSNHPESEAINAVVNYFIENKILFRALRDGEVIIHE